MELLTEPVEARIVQRDAEINERLTPAWKEWSEFKFLQKLKS